jgi:hypothetical protein
MYKVEAKISLNTKFDMVFLQNDKKGGDKFYSCYNTLNPIQTCVIVIPTKYNSSRNPWCVFYG